VVARVVAMYASDEAPAGDKPATISVDCKSSLRRRVRAHRRLMYLLIFSLLFSSSFYLRRYDESIVTIRTRTGAAVPSGHIQVLITPVASILELGFHQGSVVTVSTLTTI
jgi:hypothetical protein